MKHPYTAIQAILPGPPNVRQKRILWPVFGGTWDLFEGTCSWVVLVPVQIQGQI